MQEKSCRSCGKTKPLTEFRKRSTRSDGSQSYCKDCANRRNAVYRRTTGKEKVTQRQKAWLKSKGSEYVKASKLLRSRKFPAQTKAWILVGNAVRNGKLPRVSSCLCADCGAPAKEYHHPDYAKPLEVVPLCEECHEKRHY